MAEERITGRRAAHVDAIRQGRYVNTQRWGYVRRTPESNPVAVARRLEQGFEVVHTVYRDPNKEVWLRLEGDELIVSDAVPATRPESVAKERAATARRLGHDRAAAEGEPPEDLYRGPINPQAELFAVIAKTKADLLPALQAAQEELIKMTALADAVGGISAGRDRIAAQELRSAFDSLEALRTQLGGANWHQLGPLPKSDALMRVIRRDYIDRVDLR